MHACMLAFMHACMHTYIHKYDDIVFKIGLNTLVAQRFLFKSKIGKCSHGMNVFCGRLSRNLSVNAF